MHTKTTQRIRRSYTLKLYPAAILLTSLIGSIASPVFAASPREQTFLVTAYYSPKPDQCCYYRGTYEREIAFNGNGLTSADNTAVYPGMIAAPGSYAFGTRIELPGIGVGTVHDRGGRIIEWESHGSTPAVHRIDLWMGSGEEGLARALAWGARTIHGTVYPPDSLQPQPRWSLDTFVAPVSILALLPAQQSGLVSALTLGDTKYAVRLLQSTLSQLGYFHHVLTDFFGATTQDALARFQSDYNIPGDGSVVDDHTFALLTVASDMEKSHAPSMDILERGMRGPSVQSLQRLLRYLGHFTGRTDGIFDDRVWTSVLQFQLQHGIVARAESPGAGRVGPITTAALQSAWKAKQVEKKATALALKMSVSRTIEETKMPDIYLTKGDSGNDVLSLQVLLADLGYFHRQSANAHFGDLTRTALLTYQKDRNIISSVTEKGAGTFGPATRQALLQDVTEIAWQKVRADGIQSL